MTLFVAMKSRNKIIRKKAGHRSWAAKSAPAKGGHKGDIMSPEKRSALMSRIKNKNTGPEKLIMRELMKRKVYFQKHASDLPGRPDIVLRKIKLAIFIDGDFWHGWRLPLWKHKLSPKWQEKITKNRERDQRNFKALKRKGWIVLRIWEHQIENNLGACIDKIITTMNTQNGK